MKILLIITTIALSLGGGACGSIAKGTQLENGQCEPEMDCSSDSDCLIGSCVAGCCGY